MDYNRADMVRKFFSLASIILIGILTCPHYMFAQGIKEQAVAYSKKEREKKGFKGYNRTHYFTARSNLFLPEIVRLHWR